MKTHSRVLAFAALFAAVAPAAFAAPGDLDTTFDTDGRVGTPIGLSSDFGNGVAIQSDGKIVVAGQTFNGSNWDIAVVRYTSTGVLDTSFGGTGKVTTAFGFNDEFGTSVAVQSDGKILVVGYVLNSSYDFALVRYTSAGALDSSFGSGGLVSTPIGSGTDQAFSVAVQSDGKIVVAGFSNNGSNNDFAVVRYNTSGSLDTSFDGDGKVGTPIGSGTDQAFSVKVQSDGSIVAAGFSNNGTNDDFALVRYTSTGALDTSFNGTGKVTSPIGSGGDIGRSVAVQSDGMIVVAGYSSNGSNDDFALARYTTAGALDTGFGTGGIATTSFGSGVDQCFGLALQPNEKIVVAGYFYNGADFDVAMARYTTAGVLDTSFSGDGKVTTAFGGFHDSAASVAVQNDGKVVAAGYYHSGSNNDFAVFRYLADPVAPVVTTSATTAITSSGATLNGTVNPNGVATTAQFEYGTTISYGSTASVTLSPNNGTTAQNVSAAITGLSQNTLYHFRLTATNTGGTSNTTDGTFTTLTAYQEWAAANGMTGGNTGPNDDYEGDGVKNLEEWAYGTDPTMNSAGAIVVSGGSITQRGTPTVSVQNILNGVDFRAVFGRRKDYVTSGLTYTVQFSPDLSVWQNSAATPTVIADDGTIEACTVPYPFFVNGKKARFFRVSISMTP